MINRRNFLSRSVLAATCAAAGISSAQPYDPRFKGVELLPFQKQIVRWMDSKRLYLPVLLTRGMGATFLSAHYQKNRDNVGIIVKSEKERKKFLNLGCDKDSLITLYKGGYLKPNTFIVDGPMTKEVINTIITPLLGISPGKKDLKFIFFDSWDVLFERNDFSYENEINEFQHSIIVNSDSELIPKWMRDDMSKTFDYPKKFQA